MSRRSHVVRTQEGAAGISRARSLVAGGPSTPNAALFGSSLVESNTRQTPPVAAGMFRTDSIFDYVDIANNRFIVKQPCALSITMETQLPLQTSVSGNGEDGDLIGGFMVYDVESNNGQRINGDIHWNEYPNGAWKRGAFPPDAQTWAGINSHAVVHFNICDYDTNAYYEVIPDIYHNLGYDRTVQWKCSVVLMELGTLTWFNQS